MCHHRKIIKSNNYTVMKQRKWSLAHSQSERKSHVSVPCLFLDVPRVSLQCVIVLCAKLAYRASKHFVFSFNITLRYDVCGGREGVFYAIILMRKRKGCFTIFVVLLSCYFSFLCHLCGTVPWDGMLSVIVALSGHTH